jgi:hypothetical protein
MKEVAAPQTLRYRLISTQSDLPFVLIANHIDRVKSGYSRGMCRRLIFPTDACGLGALRRHCPLETPAYGRARVPMHDGCTNRDASS